jgi:hypothetical protein
LNKNRRIPPNIRRAIMDTNETAVRAYLRFTSPAELIPHEDLNDLRSRLTSAAQKIMGTETREMTTFLRKMLARPQVSDTALQEFYYSDLTSEERERLDRFSPEAAKAEIRALYLSRKLLLNVPTRQ